MKTSIRLSLLFTLFVAVSLILTGCGSETGDSTSTETDQEQESAQNGKSNQKQQKADEGLPELNWMVPDDLDYKPPRPDLDATLNFAYGSDPNTLNPLIANDTTSGEHLHAWTVESFATRDFRNPDKWVPRLATEWEISDDGMRYVIHLRKGVQFHPVTTPDGKQIDPGEMTAYDVRFTYQAATNPEVEAGHLRNYIGMIDEVNVKDEYTVEIVWGEKYFNAKAVTLGMLTVIPERVYGYDKDGNVISHDYTSSEFAKGFNNHWANSNAISGTGPFKLTEWSRGESFSLKRFEDYYADDFPTPASYHSGDTAPKFPLFKRIEYTLIEKPQAQYRALLNGDIVWTGLTPTIYENDLKSESKYKNGNINELIFDYPAYRYIGWNMRKRLFQNKTVRKALTHAVPRKEIIEQVFLGYARRTTGPFFFKYPAYNDNIKPYEYSLDKARSLLDKAGWDQKTEGVRYKMIDGEQVEFSFDLLHYADSPEFSQTASIISDRLKRIGIQASPDAIKWNEFLETLKARQFDASMLGWATAYVNDPYQVWHSSQAGAGGGSNHVGWVDDRTDELVEQIRVTMDQQKRRELYHKFHKLIHEQQPYTFLWTQKSIAAHYSYLHSVGETGPSELPVYSIRPNVNRFNWYIPEER